MGTYIGPPVFNSGAGGDTIPPSRCLTRYGRVTSKGYPALGTCTTLQYHFYNATCPHRCIHESLLVLYQLSNYYGRYSEFRGYRQNFNNQNRVQNPEKCHGNSAQPQRQGSAPGPRITEVPDVAAIDVLNSAVGGMKVVRELVKYVDPAEVYAGERRRHREIESAGDSIVLRARKRPAVVRPAREEVPAVAEPGPSSRRSTQVRLKMA